MYRKRSIRRPRNLHLHIRTPTAQSPRKRDSEEREQDRDAGKESQYYGHGGGLYRAGHLSVVCINWGGKEVGREGEREHRSGEGAV